MSSQPLELFRGRDLVIATMHGKERVIAPLVERYLEVRTLLPPRSFDSDRFGTFTRDVKRAGDQWEAARMKALVAMDLAGCDLAVASEGGFTPDPSIPFAVSNLELVLLVDRKNGYECAGTCRVLNTNACGQYVESVQEAVEVARGLGFPAHGVIVRRTETSNDLNKDLATMIEFERVVRKLFARPFTRRIYLETDLRAHRNPTRMAVIEQATRDLLKNIASLCPECSAPGFAPIASESGLRCSRCRMPTQASAQEVYACGRCHTRVKKSLADEGLKADPAACAYCNP